MSRGTPDLSTKLYLSSLLPVSFDRSCGENLTARTEDHGGNTEYRVDPSRTPFLPSCLLSSNRSRSLSIYFPLLFSMFRLYSFFPFYRPTLFSTIPFPRTLPTLALKIDRYFATVAYLENTRDLLTFFFAERDSLTRLYASLSVLFFIFTFLR